MPDALTPEEARERLRPKMEFHDLDAIIATTQALEALGFVRKERLAAAGIWIPQPCEVEGCPEPTHGEPAIVRRLRLAEELCETLDRFSDESGLSVPASKRDVSDALAKWRESRG